MQIPKELAKEQISQLIERFDDHIDEYKRGNYNETQTRVDYINPFFKALGWDINNEQGLAEAYREVIHEDKIKIGKSTKAPDYCFTVYGQRKFFVDAKKPSINVKIDISPAYQVRRYGWSAKLPIAIVTDFEEFSIYDCSKKPNQNDRSSVARIHYLTYKDYLKEFDFIWETFSKERILKGSFDKYVQTDTKKRGTATVDKEFLKEIDEWRKYLATTIALRNATLSEDEINYAVQKTVDRIIFLRICEDRGVEQYGNLKKAIQKGDLYKNLFELFHIADEKYNSGLFNFKEDNITSNLIIDNKVIKNIVQELYYPHSPFEFSVLPADILGSVYEQFLGKTIRLTKAHQAKIEEKPEVRKAGGVYYTPKYIVDYIVKNTVGKLLNGKTPKQLEKIKICDPACGSGSFLIGAYQYLLDWHLKYYIDKPPKKKKDGPVTPDGNLTTAEKKRILLNNIYGVDIDPQAAEVTKLNLLLKALEGETQASISKQLTFFNERVLPNLGDNIKCGNSLIGNDFYDNQLDLFPNQIKKINAFDWEEGFPEIFAKGSFDAVIGNPPYVQLKLLENNSIKYLIKSYSATNDLFSIFIERGIGLIRTKGYFSFIVPSLFIKGMKYEILRNIINRNSVYFSLKEYGDGVFEGVKMPTSVFVLQKGNGNNNYFLNENIKFFEKTKCINLELISNIKRGLEIGRDKLAPIGDIKCITGSDIAPYYIKSENFIPANVFKEFKKNMNIFLPNRILVRETGNRFVATLESEGIITTRSLYNVCLVNNSYSPSFILGILCSKLFRFYFSQFIIPETKTFPKIRIAQLKKVPIAEMISEPHINIQFHISNSANNLMSLNKQFNETKLESQRQQIQRTIKHTEKKINELVYELYGLTKEEIKIIEQTT